MKSIARTLVLPQEYMYWQSNHCIMKLNYVQISINRTDFVTKHKLSFIENYQNKII